MLTLKEAAPNHDVLHILMFIKRAEGISALYVESKKLSVID